MCSQECGALGVSCGHSRGSQGDRWCACSASRFGRERALEAHDTLLAVTDPLPFSLPLRFSAYAIPHPFYKCGEYPVETRCHILGAGFDCEHRLNYVADRVPKCLLFFGREVTTTQVHLRDAFCQELPQISFLLAWS